MTVVDVWNGRTAGVFQAALRHINEVFAVHLGVAVRTVATWRDKPDIVPRTEMQLALDTALERETAAQKDRFSALLAESSNGEAKDADLTVSAQGPRKRRRWF